MLRQRREWNYTRYIVKTEEERRKSERQKRSKN